MVGSLPGLSKFFTLWPQALQFPLATLKKYKIGLSANIKCPHVFHCQVDSVAAQAVDRMYYDLLAEQVRGRVDSLLVCTSDVRTCIQANGTFLTDMFI